jgi:hypothetical protein
LPRDEILFYVEESQYGCPQPVRAGDMLRVKHMGRGWPEEGQIVIVLDVDRHTYVFDDDGGLSNRTVLLSAQERDECTVLIGDKKVVCKIEYLEALGDAR